MWLILGCVLCFVNQIFDNLIFCVIFCDAKNKKAYFMNKKIKLGSVKYLIAAASLLPIAKPAEAKHKTKEDLPSVGEYTMFFSAGFEHLVPSPIVNSQIKSKELEGFNPGAFLEIGVANWSGQHGKSNYEYHIGFSGRVDYHNFHSRAYSMNERQNINIMAGEPYKYVDPAEYGCSDVQDIVSTLNVRSDFGWYGVVFNTNAGLGWHFDNHGNAGPVLVFGCGVGYRFDKNFRLDARWRLNMFPFENLGSKTRLSTTHGLRNNLEISLIYKLNAYKKDMQKKHTRTNNGKHR